MATKIKLQRKGTKSKPTYRLVIQEAKSKLSGKVIEIIGEYNPRQAIPFINFNKEKVEHWISKGAQPTEKVRALLGKAGILPPIDTSLLTKRKPKKSKETASQGEENKQEEAK